MIAELRKIYGELYRLLDAAGHGAVTRIQLAAGLGGSYLRDQRRRLASGQDRNYDLSVLLRVLQALRVDAGVFFAKVFGALHPIALTQLEAHRLGEPPELVARVIDRLRMEGWQPLAKLPEHVRRLDAHRYRDAREAARFARDDLDKVVAGLLPAAWGVPLLGVYGSALRMLEEHDASLQTLVAALEVTEPTGDQATLGDLLQRLAYAVADRCGDHRRALRLGRRATDFHFLAGDLNKAGKTLVDRGRWLSKLRRFQEADQVLIRALELLGSEEHRHRFSALQILGLVQCELGNLRGAHQHAARAAELAPHVGSWLASMLLRLRARIAIEQRQYDAAEAHLREAIEVFSPVSAGEAARATAELVRVLLLQDRPDEAVATAKTMAQFIVPLEEESEVAAKAAVELLNSGQAGGGITMELVDRVVGVLDKERARWKCVPAPAATPA